MKPHHLAVLLAALSCALTAAPSSGVPAVSKPRATAGSKPASSPRMVLPFISDDYTRALTEARARRVPLFVEAWAPW